MSVRSLSAIAGCAALLLVGGPAAAQCRTATVTGATSTVNNVAGVPVPGSVLSSTGSNDGVTYQVTNLLGLLPTPSVQTMFSSMLENGYSFGTGRGGGPAYYGGVFSNPTASALTVTRVDVTTNIVPGAPTGGGVTNAAGLFFDLVSGSTTPSSGWARIDQSTMRWTGSLSVPANSGQAFLFASQLTFSDSIWSYTAGMNVTVSGGTTYSAPSFTIQSAGSNDPYAANAVVGFDTAAAATYAPQTYLASGAYIPGATIDFPVRVRETGNNPSAGSPDSRNGVARNLQLVVTIPAGWTAVSVPTASSPWGGASVVQPTATAAGSVTINTTNNSNGEIDTGKSTPIGSLVIRARAPLGTYVTSLFPFTFTLNGDSQTSPVPPRGPVTSKNESIVRVVGSGGVAGVNSEFLSAAMPFPVRQIDFRAEFNMLAGTGAETVNVDVFDNVGLVWTTLGTVTPAASPDSVVTATFGSNLKQYMDASGKIKVRLVSAGAASRVLGVDLLQWSVIQGYTVNILTGSNANVGDAGHPFKAIGSAVAALAAGGAAYVEVGSSRTATAYAAGNALPSGKSGTPACPTLLQGVSDVSGLPLVTGTNPSSDVGFDVGSDWVVVDGFEVQGTQAAFYSEPATVGVRFSNNIATVGSLGFGIVLDSSRQAVVLNNRVSGGGGSFFGIYEYTGTGNTIDGNRVLGHGAAGIISEFSSGLTLQRNVSRGNYIGAHVANATGAANIYDNTFDANTFLGVYCETATVTSRNNIVTGNVVGWAWNEKGSVSSDYDDVFGNTSNYTYKGIVATGSHSISAAPSFVQTSNPALATYYQLNGGSPCINKGINVGLPFLGSSPDLGAVETQ